MKRNYTIIEIKQNKYAKFVTSLSSRTLSIPSPIVDSLDIENKNIEITLKVINE